MALQKIVDSMRDVVVDKITKGADIASSSTMVIGTDGGYFDITGTTGITAMTVAAGRVFTLQFDGAVVLTNSSTLKLSGATNFTTAAGDHLTFVSVAANDVRQVGFGLTDGGSPVAAAGGVDGITTSANATAISISSDEEVTMPKQPACLLYGADSTNLNITGNGTLATVVMAERYDQNNDFDGTSTFTAPQTGKYLVSIATTMNQNTSASDYAYVYIVYSNGSIRFEQGNTNDLQTQGIAMSLTALIDMDAADTAQFKVKVAGESSDPVDLQGHWGTENRTIMSITLLC